MPQNHEIFFLQIFSLPLWDYVPTWCRIIPLLVFASITLWSYSWIPNSEGQGWSLLDELIQIPGVYYIYFLLGWAILMAFIAIERKYDSRRHMKSSAISGPSSSMKRILWLSAAILVYGIHVGISVAVELRDVQQSLITLMITFCGNIYHW